MGPFEVEKFRVPKLMVKALNKLVFGTARANKSFKQKNHKRNSQTSVAQATGVLE